MPRFTPRHIALSVPLVAALLAGCSKQTAVPTARSDAPTAAASQTAPASMPAGAGLALADATVQLPAVAGRPGVAYFTLNAGPAAKGALVAVSVAHFARAEMHKSVMQGTTMTMIPIAKLPITPGQPIVFAPGGQHVMLFDADTAIKPGDTTTLTASFADGTTMTIPAKVTAQGGDAMGGMAM